MGFQAFKILLGTAVILLFIQFWLGMSINLFVSVPMYRQQDFSSYGGGQEVFAHIASGVVILVLAGLILSFSSRLRSRAVIVFSAAGLVFAVIAAATGATFLFKGQDDVLSLSMAVSFLLAFTVYLSEFHLLRKMTE